MSKISVIKKLYTDGRIEECDEKMTLAEAQAFVGGWIEYVPTTDDTTSLVVNEEGALTGLSENEAATELVKSGVYVIDTIRGNALIVKA